MILPFIWFSRRTVLRKVVLLQSVQTARII
nr:MAG TPA: hypothetical protein [Caudoviricetes sp.]